MGKRPAGAEGRVKTTQVALIVKEHYFFLLWTFFGVRESVLDMHWGKEWATTIPFVFAIEWVIIVSSCGGLFGLLEHLLYKKCHLLKVDKSRSQHLIYSMVGQCKIPFSKSLIKIYLWISAVCYLDHNCTCGLSDNFLMQNELAEVREIQKLQKQKVSGIGCELSLCKSHDVYRSGEIYKFCHFVLCNLWLIP